MSECFAISSVQKLPLPSHFPSVSTDRNRLCAQSINYSNKLDPCSVATQSAATITLNYLHLSPGSSTGRTLLSTSTMLENAWKTPGAQFHSFPYQLRSLVCALQQQRRRRPPFRLPIAQIINSLVQHFVFCAYKFHSDNINSKNMVKIDQQQQA